jgi:GTPase SAR1 family protein
MRKNLHSYVAPFFSRDRLPIILVANKVDLSTRRRVSEEDGLRMAQKLGLPYLETSAKDPPVNIDEAFREVLFQPRPTPFEAFLALTRLIKLFPFSHRPCA